MVDNAQKGAYARSVAGLAAQLALTDWLVDIRHEATHTQLPGLPVLRLAAAEVCSPQASNTKPKILTNKQYALWSFFSDAWDLLLPAITLWLANRFQALSWLRIHYWEKQANHVRIATQAVADKLDAYISLAAAVKAGMPSGPRLHHLRRSICSICGFCGRALRHSSQGH
jgi:hypothetical protein